MVHSHRIFVQYVDTYMVDQPHVYEHFNIDKAKVYLAQEGFSSSHFTRRALCWISDLVRGKGYPISEGLNSLAGNAASANFGLESPFSV